MPDNGSGTYTLPQAAFVSGTTISSAAVNNDFADIATALNNRMTRNGESGPSANVPMGTFRHTNVGNATARDQYAAVGQVADGTFQLGGTSTGSANVHAINTTPGIPAYIAGQRFGFLAGFTSTGAVTLAVSGLAAKSLFGPDGTTAPRLLQGTFVEVWYDGTNFRQVVPTVGWQGIGPPTIFTGATAVVQYSLPAAFRRFRLEYSGVTTAAAAAFLRLSNDNGATFKSGAADYSYAALSIRPTTAVSSGAVQTFVPMSENPLVTGVVFGSLELDTPNGRGLYDTHVITTGPMLTRYSGTFNCGFVGTITDVLIGVIGSTWANGRFRLLGGF